MSARSRPAATPRAAAAAPARRAAIPPPLRAVLGTHGTKLAPALRTQLGDGLGIDLSGIPSHPRAAPSLVAASDHPEERLADRLSRGVSRDAAARPHAADALAHIRVHTGPLAAMAARALHAQAFALDGHLVFGAGAWRPETAEGRALIAHEVVHAARPGAAGTVWRKALSDGSSDTDKATPTDLAQIQAKTNEPEEEPGQPGPQATATPGLATPPPPPSPTGALGAAAAVPAPTPAPGTEPQQQAANQPKQVSDIGTGDLALIDEELAEHERWGAAAATVGTAGSAERAEFLAEQAGGGLAKGAAESAKGVLGVSALTDPKLSAGERALGALKSGPGMKVAEKLVEKAAIATAVKLGAKAGAFKSVPGVGAVIGGALAVYDLAKRDWGKTGDQIAGFGKGADIYEQLANSIESISTVLEVATQVANVIAGILGVIVVISWIAAVASGGALGPVATLLSTIAIKIGLVSMVIDAINALVLKPLISTFRAMHAFASEADPRDVVAQGEAIDQAAGAATGFASGFIAGKAFEKGMHMASGKSPTKVPEHATPPAKGGEGPHVKAQPPPETTAKPAAAAAPEPAKPPQVAPEPETAARDVTPPPDVAPSRQGPTGTEPASRPPPAEAPAQGPAKPAPAAETPPAGAAPEVPAATPAGETAKPAAAEPALQPAPAPAPAPEAPATAAPPAPAAAEPAVGAATPEPAAAAGPMSETPAATTSAAPEAAAAAPAQEVPATATVPAPGEAGGSPLSEPPGASRKQKGEAVWAATEQLGEKFDMDFGVAPGDRISLENKAATRRARLLKQMDAAGFKPVGGGKKVSNVNQWEPKGDKTNIRRAQRAQKRFQAEMTAIAEERIKLREKARQEFFSKETGQTTIDIENWNPEADAVPGGPGPNAPIDKPLVPDVVLPLSEPKRVTTPREGASEAGMLARHEHHPPRGKGLISEHVQPGAQFAAVTDTPSGPIYDERQYAMDKTLTVDKDVADIKTHKGPNSDNKRTEALTQKAASGQRVDVIQDIYLPSIEQTHWAMDEAARRRAATGGPPPAGAAAAPATAAAPVAQAGQPVSAPSVTPPAAAPGLPAPAPAAPAPAASVPAATTPAASVPATSGPVAPTGAGSANLPTADAPHPQVAAPASAAPTQPVEAPVIPESQRQLVAENEPKAATQSDESEPLPESQRRRVEAAAPETPTQSDESPPLPESQRQRVEAPARETPTQSDKSPPLPESPRLRVEDPEREAAIRQQQELEASETEAPAGPARRYLPSPVQPSRPPPGTPTPPSSPGEGTFKPTGGPPSAKGPPGAAPAEPAKPPTLKSDAPITERVNPPYQPPPATPEQIVSLRNQVLDTLAMRAQQEQYVHKMAQQEKHHEANQKPLADMQAKTGEALTATEAHKAAIAHRDEANQRKVQEEKKATDKLDDYNTRSAELATIKYPLIGVQKFTGIAAGLPDDPDPVRRFKNGMLKMNSDATKFIGRLEEVDKTIASQKAESEKRKAGASADGDTLHQTDQKAGTSKEALDNAKQTNTDLDSTNTDRLEEAKTEKTDATKAAATLGAQAQKKQQQADSLAAAMQFWAQQHRKTRLDALEQSRKRLEVLDWKVTEVVEG